MLALARQLGRQNAEWAGVRHWVSRSGDTRTAVEAAERARDECRVNRRNGCAAVRTMAHTATAEVVSRKKGCVVAAGAVSRGEAHAYSAKAPCGLLGSRVAGTEPRLSHLALP